MWIFKDKRFSLLPAFVAFLLAAGGACRAAESYWSENPLNRPQGKAPVIMAFHALHPPVLGGGLSAWKMAAMLQMDRYDASTIRLRPEYQRVNGYAQWDATALYLAFEVFDPDQINSGQGESLWDGDSVQIAVVKDRVWQEFVFALTPRGPESYCWQYAPAPEVEYRLLGKRQPAGVRLNVVREADRTLYFAAIPVTELKLPALAVGDELRFNVAVFDRSAAGPKISDYVVLADGLCGPKFIAPFARLKLVATPKEVRLAVGPRAGLLPNPSFEEGDSLPSGWSPSAEHGGKAEWVTTTASSGCHALRFALSAPGDVARWSLNTSLELKPKTAYTLLVRSKGNGRVKTFHLCLTTGGVSNVVDLPAQQQWKTTGLVFSTGKTPGGTLYVEALDGKGTAEAYLDDVILTAGAAPGSMVKTPEVACLTDTALSSTVQSLCALYPDRLKIFDVTQPVDWAAVGTFEKLLIIPRNPALLKKADWAQVKTQVAGGKIAVLDLTSYAVMTGVRLTATSLPAASPWEAFQKLEKKLQTPEAAAKAAQEEENLPIPLAVVTADNELSAGFPAGSEVPWFGRANSRFHQRQLPLALLPKSAQVTAKSTAGDGAVWIRQPLNKGCFYAVDINSLGEMTMQWPDRGSYNKYVPVQNALGHGLRYGLYWNRRVAYQEYVERLKALVKQYPALTLTVEGYADGYNRYGICLGNPKGPIYLYTGTTRAQSDYRSGMYGLYAFAAYLGKNAGVSPLKERLAQIGVKIIPVVQPELYIAGSLAQLSKYPGKEERLPLTKWAGEQDDVRLAIQQHHGVGPLMVGFGYSLNHGAGWAKAIYNYATEKLYAIPPTVYWDLTDASISGPQPLDIVSGVGPNPPVWDAYFSSWPNYSGLGTITEARVRAAKLNVLAEYTTYGASPAANDFTVPVREYQSALLTDQSVTFLLSSLLVDPR